MNEKQTPRARRTKGEPAGPGELTVLRKSFSGALAGVGGLSALSNVLMLTGPFFMLEIYDRVLPSRSVPTLVILAMFAVLLYACQGVFDWLRGRILVRISSTLDEALSRRVHDLAVRLSLRRGGAEGLEPMRELERVRTFLAGGGPGTLFDLPWLPFYLIIVFLLHPLLGAVAIAGAAVLFGLAVCAELRTKGPAAAARLSGRNSTEIGAASVRNAEALTAMGIAGNVSARWQQANRTYVGDQQRGSDVAGNFGALSRTLRFILQSGILGVGAWLVIEQEITGGAIIAASILTARALAPVEGIIAHWKGLLSARQSWARLGELMTALPVEDDRLALPAPASTLEVEGLILTPPSGQRVVVNGVSFTLAAGQGLGIIGPSASGKSSLVRALAGVWPAVRGRIGLDGAAIEQWDSHARGRHIGYLPQDVELIAGSIADNIARFDPNARDEAIVAAAQAAGVHGMIVEFPDGYQTQVGEDGLALSAGQRQRIALARALYGDPFLVILDEPNSNLDADGEAALTRAIAEVRRRNGIVVVVAHRPSALVATDTILMMREGRVEKFGPKSEILPTLVRPAQVHQQQQSTVEPAVSTGVAR